MRNTFKKDKSLNLLKVYRYIAVNKIGESVKGTVRAENKDDAQSQVLEKGLTVRDIKQKPQLLLKRAEQKPIKRQDITLFFRQLSTMINAGVSVSQALEFVANGIESIKMSSLVLNLHHMVASGNSLGTAMAKYPLYFDPLICNLVKVGEESGTLDSILNRIAVYLERIATLKSRIKKSIFYPVFVLVIMVALSSLLLIFIVPRFQGMYQSFGKELPAATQAIIGASNILQEYWWLVILIMFILTLLHFALRQRSETYKELLANFAIKVPVFGPLIRKATTARIVRTLSVTLSAGVTISNALLNTSRVAGNRIYARSILAVRERVMAGEKMGDAMRDSTLFSSLVTQMVSVGEQSGALETMLEKVADYYEEQVDMSVDAISSLIEPLLIVMLGLMIGVFVIAMYLPIFNIGTLI